MDETTARAKAREMGGVAIKAYKAGGRWHTGGWRERPDATWVVATGDKSRILMSELPDPEPAGAPAPPSRALAPTADADGVQRVSMTIPHRMSRRQFVEHLAANAPDHYPGALNPREIVALVRRDVARFGYEGHQAADGFRNVPDQAWTWAEQQAARLWAWAEE